MATRLVIPATPRLPTSPREADVSDRRFTDEYSRVLGLYFRQLDTVNASLLGTRGGRYLDNPYGAFQRNSDFNFATANTATLITVGDLDYANGVSYVPGDGIHVAQSGIYNLQYSVQLANTDTQTHNAWIWLRKNGADLAGTGSKFDVHGSHGGGDGYLIATCNFYVSLAAGDWVELWGAAAQVENGVTNGVYIEAYAAQVAPFAMPAVPSVVLTLSFVSAVP